MSIEPASGDPEVFPNAFNPSAVGEGTIKVLHKVAEGSNVMLLTAPEVIQPSDIVKAESPSFVHDEASETAIAELADQESVTTRIISQGDSVADSDLLFNQETSRSSSEIQGSSKTGIIAAQGAGLSQDLQTFIFGDNVRILHCNSTAASEKCVVYLVGTAHVSLESCNEVRKVIHCVKPQVVFVELCASRTPMLMPQTWKVPTFEEMLAMRKKGMNPFGIIYSWFLAKLAEKLEVFPGSEFRVAYEEAIACGAKISLGDRPVQITLRRTWAKMSTWHKAKLTFLFLFQGFFMSSASELNQLVEEMKDTDMMTLIIQEMSKSFPTVIDTLLHERDLYMAATLRGVAQNCSSVVAVVGKGHLSGIMLNWEQEISIEALMVVPHQKPSWVSRPVIHWGAIALGIGGLAIAVGVHLHRKR